MQLSTCAPQHDACSEFYLHQDVMDHDAAPLAKKSMYAKHLDALS